MKQVKDISSITRYEKKRSKILKWPFCCLLVWLTHVMSPCQRHPPQTSLLINVRGTAVKVEQTHYRAYCMGKTARITKCVSWEVNRGRCRGRCMTLYTKTNSTVHFRTASQLLLPTNHATFLSYHRTPCGTPHKIANSQNLQEDIIRGKCQERGRNRRSCSPSCFAFLLLPPSTTPPRAAFLLSARSPPGPRCPCFARRVQKKKTIDK